MKKLLVFLILIFQVFVVTPAFAKCPPGSPEGSICLDNPLEGDKTDVTQIIGTIIKGLLGVLGSLALLMLVWGGFQWLTSAGNMEKVESGTKTMLWSVIGVVVVLSSYMLVNTILNLISK